MIVERGTNRTLLTVNEAAEAVGVSRRTMYVWIAKKIVQIRRVASGKIYVYEDTLFSKER